jgi:hypothetical protein
MLGGLIAATMGAVIVRRIDGDTDAVEPSEEAKKTVEKMQARGVLIGAGYIAGESLLGVFLAVLIVLDVDLSAMLGITALGDLASLLFFLWFVGVFVALVAQTMPRGVTPVMVLTVITTSVRRTITKMVPSMFRPDES